MSQGKIVVDFIRPSIPIRSFDYCAYYEGEEERGEYGYGATEQEAIDDLLAEYPVSAAEVQAREDNSQFGVGA